MVSEQQASKELMIRNWSFGHFEELGKIDAALKEVGIPPSQALQLIEATTELKDAEFRVAAFDLLELKKRTSKNSKEVEAYIQSLGAQIISKEKLSSSWTGKIEKVKGELKEWEQKRNEERAKFEREQAQHKRLLKADEEKLNLELRENNEVRANIEETIGLKAELAKISMDLPTFKSILRETVLKGGITPHIGKDIKAAVKTFVSLGKAILEWQREEKVRRKTIGSLSQEEEKRKAVVQGLGERSNILCQEIKKHTGEINSKVKLILDLDEQIENYKEQWEFFQLFISMVIASPSVPVAPHSLRSIALSIRALEEEGWKHRGGLSLPEQRRAGFITIVMGAYLHSIHCSKCGASFIINAAFTDYYRFHTSYECPVCRFSFYTKPDDTFFNLMVSPKLAEKFKAMRHLLEALNKMKTGDIESLGEKLKLLDAIDPEVYKFLQEGGNLHLKVKEWR